MFRIILIHTNYFKKNPLFKKINSELGPRFCLSGVVSSICQSWQQCAKKGIGQKRLLERPINLI